MKYRIRHRTTYAYSEPVTVSHHAARVQPRETPNQRVEEWNLRIDPEPAVHRSGRDYFGNHVFYFSVQGLHRHLEIEAESMVEVTPPASPPGGAGAPWEEVAAMFRAPVSDETLEAQQFIFESPHVRPSAELARLASASFTRGRPLLEAMRELNRRIHREFVYDPKATTVATPLEEVLKDRRGVCQDFTHVALGCLRSLGLAGRYVSGYLRTHRSEDAAALVGSDASHAWLAVFSPGQGWIEFDPTNDLLPSLDHIAVAYGRDFADVSPVTGMIVGGGDHVVRVAVAVNPV